MDSGAGEQLGASGAAGTLGAADPLPADTDLVAYLDEDSGSARTRVVGDTAVDCYTWNVVMSFA